MNYSGKNNGVLFALGGLAVGGALFYAFQHSKYAVSRGKSVAPPRAKPPLNPSQQRTAAQDASDLINSFAKGAAEVFRSTKGSGGNGSVSVDDTVSPTDVGQPPTDDYTNPTEEGVPPTDDE